MKPIVIGKPVDGTEYEPRTVPRPDDATYPWSPKLSKNEKSRFAAGAGPFVMTSA